MTVIRPNSISGVTSITALANEINVFKHDGVLAGLQLNGVNHHTSSGVSTFHTLNVLGNVSVGGTLTYQDVTNVDSVGVITARSTIDAQGDVSIADKIIHTGDTNTAIRFPANDTITFETAGSERLRITSDGRIGMHDSSPNDYELDIMKRSTATDANLRLYNNATGSSNDTILRLHIAGTSASNYIYFGDGDDSNVGQIRYQHSNDSMRIHTAGSERLRITPNQVLIGTTTSSGYTNRQLVIGDTSTSSSFIEIRCSSSGTGHVLFADSAAADANNYTGYIGYTHSNNSMTFHTNGGNERLRISSGGSIGVSHDLTGTSNYNRLMLNNPHDGSCWLQMTSTATGTSANTDGLSIGLNTSNQGHIWLRENANMYFATNNTSRMEITKEGYFIVGTRYGSNNHRINGNGFTQGQTYLVVSAYNSSSQDTAIFFGVNTMGGNTASCAIKVGTNSSNNRSINCGGTVNASGSDYAEYMVKASDFTLAKGDICGINAEGKLTNKFSESISFVVKSTNPSYVGGDTWGGEDILGEKPKDDSPDLPAYELKMETARKLVDRIAFSGQVPVNVTGTTAGQHIIPTAGSGDTIIGVAKAEASLSMAEYISSIGKVIALESDGRARIIVKVS